MSAATVEVFLARLYSDATLREIFLRDSVEALSDLEITADERRELMVMDRAGLQMAATSFAHKRTQHSRKSNR
jgi:hypothetical protein